MIDAKALYDAVHKGIETGSSGLGLRDKISALELLALLESLEAGETLVKWVHSEAQLADSLTKPGAKDPMSRYLMTGKWTIVWDPEMRSAKERKKLKLPKMQSSGDYRSSKHVEELESFPEGAALIWGAMRRCK